MFLLITDYIMCNSSRVAEASKNPKAAVAAGKKYFSDLNDIYEFSVQKNGDAILAAYKSSLKDLAAFQALVQ